MTHIHQLLSNHFEQLLDLKASETLEILFSVFLWPVFLQSRQQHLSCDSAASSVSVVHTELQMLLYVVQHYWLFLINSSYVFMFAY